MRLVRRRLRIEQDIAASCRFALRRPLAHAGRGPFGSYAVSMYCHGLSNRCACSDTRPAPHRRSARRNTARWRCGSGAGRRHWDGTTRPAHLERTDFGEIERPRGGIESDALRCVVCALSRHLALERRIRSALVEKVRERLQTLATSFSQTVSGRCLSAVRRRSVSAYPTRSPAR